MGFGGASRWVLVMQSGAGFLKEWKWEKNMRIGVSGLKTEDLKEGNGEILRRLKPISTDWALVIHLFPPHPKLFNGCATDIC